MDDFKEFAAEYMSLNWGQITLNRIDGSHIATPLKNIMRKKEYNNQTFFWIWKQIVFFSYFRDWFKLKNENHRNK